MTFSERFIDSIARGYKLKDYENLLRDFFSHLKIDNYVIYLKKPGGDFSLFLVKKSLLAINSSIFYKEFHINQKNIGRIELPQNLLPSIHIQDWNFITAVLAHCYLIQDNLYKIDQNVLTKDLELASRMQRNLIPEDLFCNENFCSEGLYIPTFLVGGDFYDVIPVTDNKIAFYIGDISGKGVNAAIIMSNFQAIVRSILIREFSLEQTIDIINYKLYEMTKGEKFLTLFLGVYNATDKRLIYINCGHMPPAFYDNKRLEWLDKGTTILGAFDQLPFIELGKKTISSTKHLFLYTDGLLNMHDEDQQYFDQKTLEHTFMHTLKNKDPKDVIQYFQSKSETPEVPDDLKDDVSILAIELK